MLSRSFGCARTDPTPPAFDRAWRSREQHCRGRPTGRGTKCRAQQSSRRLLADFPFRLPAARIDRAPQDIVGPLVEGSDQRTSGTFHRATPGNPPESIWNVACPVFGLPSVRSPCPRPVAADAASAAVDPPDGAALRARRRTPDAAGSTPAAYTAPSRVARIEVPRLEHAPSRLRRWPVRYPGRRSGRRDTANC